MPDTYDSPPPAEDLEVGYETGGPPVLAASPFANMTEDEHRAAQQEAMRDPAGVAFAVVGRNGYRLQFNYPLGEFETGSVVLAQDIAPEVQEFDLLGYMTPHVRATGQRYADVTVDLKIRPKFPTGTDPRKD
jgi:hypothetical protein